nr:TolC family protein [uncultured Sulfurimonas sp.]
MKLKLFLVFFISLNIYAQNLSQILDSLKDGKKTLAITEKTSLDIAQSELFDTQEAPELTLNISHADETSKDGSEYAVALSQNLMQPFASSSKKNATQDVIKAIKQTQKRDLLLLSLEVASRYHSACISKEMSEGADTLFKEQNTKYSQLERAYELGEISKKSLLFNKLDLAKLQQKVLIHKREYTAGISHLQERVDGLTLQELSCSDLLQITRDVSLKSIEKHSQMQKISYEQSSANSFYKVYDSMFNSLAYELVYEKELDKTRYTFGLSFPLGFATSQKQKQQAEYLHKSSTLMAEKEALSFEIKNTSASMHLRVQALYDEYMLLNQEILPMSLELKELSKSALTQGEGSVMEYLDATRSYIENLLEMLEVKKNYYDELFELYKKADLDLGEKL